MAIDHIGIFLWQHAASTGDAFYIVGFVFRCIGRLAFPIFVLLLVEGLIHSRSAGRYLLRLAMILGLVMVVQIIIYYAFEPSIGANPFVDLVIDGLFIFLIKQKGKKKLLALLPFAYVVMSTTIAIVELSSLELTVYWFPQYLRMGYSAFGFLLALAFYCAYKLADNIALSGRLTLGATHDEIASRPEYRSLVNILMAAALFALNIIIWILPYFSSNLDIYMADIQTWSLFACLLLFMYTGKRGYDARWFRYASYAFFPAHIALIYLIFALIFGK